MTRGEFWEHIETICNMASASVTSGHRSPRRNATVGGDPNSRHLIGMAADLVPDVWPTDAYKVEYWAERLGLMSIKESDHVHVQVPRVE